MKGMSSMVGVVLILAFTLVVAALIFTFSEKSLEEKISGVSDSEVESYCLLHVSLEGKNTCLSGETVSLTFQNKGDAIITSDSAFRFTNGERTCLVPLFMPESEELLPFETQTFEININDCGFDPSNGDIIPFVELNEKSYSCGVKENFEIKECNE